MANLFSPISESGTPVLNSVFDLKGVRELASRVLDSKDFLRFISDLDRICGAKSLVEAPVQFKLGWSAGGLGAQVSGSFGPMVVSVGALEVAEGPVVSAGGCLLGSDLPVVQAASEVREVSGGFVTSLCAQSGRLAGGMAGGSVGCKGADSLGSKVGDLWNPTPIFEDLKRVRRLVPVPMTSGGLSGCVSAPVSASVDEVCGVSDVRPLVFAAKDGGGCSSVG